MTLSTRLSLFFLGALAVVLAGFSVSVYLLAQTYLNRQLDDRLEATLDALAMAAEIKADHVDWDLEDRVIRTGVEPGGEPVRWLVVGQKGTHQFLYRSPDLDCEALLVQAAADPASNDANAQSWRVRQRRLEPRAPAKKGNEKRADRSQSVDDHKYTRLILVAAMSRAPVDAALRTLATTLAGLSLAVWMIAAVVGRWLSRRALAPLNQMAASARHMTGADLAQRLPSPGTRDELQDLSAAFNDLLARLQESFARQQRFTGDASHQLRTPLTIMLGQIEVARRRERSLDHYQELLDTLHEQATELQRIVEMLLFLARADAEACLTDLEPLDLVTWLPDWLQSWSAHPRRSDLRVKISADRPLLVKVQAPLLTQLLNNLLDNACKYSDAESPIDIELRGEAAMAQLTVSDAGRGIAPEDLPHIFEPFYRSAQARRQGLAGVGLGLAVAQRIAAAFGGRIDVHSRSGQGAQFILTLPLHATHVPAAN